MNLPEGDVGTLANVISVTGAALVAKGIQTGVDTPEGLLTVAAGRSCDLIDGPWSRFTDTDSDLGAYVDASCDKGGCAAILLTLWRKGIVPDLAAAGMAIQNTANGYATQRARKTHPGEELLPSRAGKRAMFWQNVGLLSYASSGILEKQAQTSRAVNYNKAARASRWAGHAATAVGVLYYGVPATRGYFKRI